MIDKNCFKQTMVRLRNECGLSQNRLASMLGVSAQAVSKWETGASLPDIDLLPALSQALGASIDHLLMPDAVESAKQVEVGGSLLGFDIPDDSAGLLSAMGERLTRRQLYRCAKLVEDEKLSFKLALEAQYSDHGSQNALTRKLDLKALPPAALAAMGAPLADLAIQAVNRDSNPIQEIMHILRCPACGGDMQYFKDVVDEYISCGEHRYPLVEGVVDFGSLEIHGYTWSSWLRTYDHFRTKLEQLNTARQPVHAYYMKMIERMVHVIQESKPAIILDIGSGMATLVREVIQHIKWPCTIILTDLSHRVLKYDKRLFDESPQNPNVNLVYLACDVRTLPVKDDILPMVVSYGGLESVSGNIDTAFHETHRVLATNGCLNSSLSLVEDRAAAGTQRWLKLIEIDPDPDMPGFLMKISDLKQWYGKLKSFGFHQHHIELVKKEDAPPEADKFPYDCEIARWMASAVIHAVKA